MELVQGNLRHWYLDGRQGNIELAIFATSVVDPNFPECRKQKTKELPRRPFLTILHYLHQPAQHLLLLCIFSLLQTLPLPPSILLHY